LLVMLAVIAVFGVSAYVGWNLTHPEREKIDSSPVGLPFENVSFRSRVDSLVLRGWLIRAPGNRATVIFAHGYGKNRLQEDVPVLPIARDLVQHGYNVLMFDFRDSGESDGTMTSVGQFEVLDLLGAVDFVQSRPPLSRRIVLYGFSMGASTAILAAARDPAVTAVIADSPFADLKTYLLKNLSDWTNLPSFPFNQAFMLVVPPLTGLDPGKVSPVREIKNLDGRPLLLIHGEADTDVPIGNSESLQKAYPQARLWRVSGAGHVQSFAVAGDAYLQKVEAFLNMVGDPGSGG